MKIDTLLIAAHVTVLKTKDGMEFFYSYNTLIGIIDYNKPADKDGIPVAYATELYYSRTTNKHLRRFLPQAVPVSQSFLKSLCLAYGVGMVLSD